VPDFGTPTVTGADVQWRPNAAVDAEGVLFVRERGARVEHAFREDEEAGKVCIEGLTTFCVGPTAAVAAASFRLCAPSGEGRAVGFVEGDLRQQEEVGDLAVYLEQLGHVPLIGCVARSLFFGILCVRHTPLQESRDVAVLHREALKGSLSEQSPGVPDPLDFREQHVSGLLQMSKDAGHLRECGIFPVGIGQNGGPSAEQLIGFQFESQKKLLQTRIVQFDIPILNLSMRCAEVAVEKDLEPGRHVRQRQIILALKGLEGGQQHGHDHANLGHVGMTILDVLLQAP